MYEENDPWPFKCFECLEEFTKVIGRLKARNIPRHPTSGSRLAYSDERLLFASPTVNSRRILKFGKICYSCRPSVRGRSPRIGLQLGWA